MFRRVAVIAATVLIVSSAASVRAQQLPDFGGAALFHGNYCGPGNRGLDKAPIDGLDLACRHHDLCYGSDPVTSCGCNATLSREASAVATSPNTEPDVAVLAGIVANGALVLPCHP